MTLTLPQQSKPPSLQPTGWLRYLSFSVDHKVIGLQYLVCGFAFYLIGGALAGAIRTELTSPSGRFYAPGGLQPGAYLARHCDDLSLDRPGREWCLR